MQLRYSFRPYPSPGQQIALARAFGCARVVFDDVLAAVDDDALVAVIRRSLDVLR